MPEHLALRLAISLGIGLLIGVERERRKGPGPARLPAGIRTFALTALTGGICMGLESELLLVVMGLAVAAFGLFAWRRRSTDDPGLTTVMALLTTLLLGALAVRLPELAAGLAVVVTILLASRTRLHRFAQDVLTEQELNDALFFAAATLIILPLTPNRPVGPLGVLNLHTLWELVIIVLSISAAGHIALRTLGPRYGLPLVGFASGFISSAATIGSMGARAAREPEVLPAAVAGAVLSTVSTMVQMSIVLWITHRTTFASMRLALLCGGISAIIWGFVMILRVRKSERFADEEQGRAFSLLAAILFAVTVSAIMLTSAAVNHWLGTAGLVLAAGLAGFADTHSAAISIASLAAAGQITAADTTLPILAGLTTNTLTKAIVAFTTGGRRFALMVVAGLLLVIVSLWVGIALN